MGAAVIGTALGLYIVVNQDTSHGAEHHPLGDPHGEGDAPKTGTDSSVGEENKDEEPEEESKEESEEAPKAESKDESEKPPKNEHQDPNKATTENSEEKDKQSPDESDKVRGPPIRAKIFDTNLRSLIPARKRPRAPTRPLASKRVFPTMRPTTPRKSPSRRRRARRERVSLRLLSCKELSRPTVLVLRTRRSAVTPRWTRTHKFSSPYLSGLECYSTVAATIHIAALVYCVKSNHLMASFPAYVCMIFEGPHSMQSSDSGTMTRILFVRRRIRANCKSSSVMILDLE